MGIDKSYLLDQLKEIIMIYIFDASANKKCLKCGNMFSPSVIYCYLACEEIKNLADSRRKMPTHLHKRCNWCGWGWLELTRDSDYQGNTIDFPPEPIMATVGNPQSLHATLEALHNGKPVLV